jgi:hypothetical protein
MAIVIETIAQGFNMSLGKNQNALKHGRETAGLLHVPYHGREVYNQEKG